MREPQLSHTAVAQSAATGTRAWVAEGVCSSIVAKIGPYLLRMQFVECFADNCLIGVHVLGVPISVYWESACVRRV